LPQTSLLRDTAGAERQVQWASGKYAGTGIIQSASWRAAGLGKIQKAREQLGQAEDIFHSSHFKESEAGAAAGWALLEAVVGNMAAAHQHAAASEAMSRTRANLPTAALALAFAGDFNGAKRLMDDLRLRYPSDFQVNGVVGPCVEALMQSARGNTSAAIQALQPATRYELATYFGFIPVYVRGLIYLRGHLGKEAGAEFQKILDHRFLTAATYTYALSYVGLARSWSEAGDSVKARGAYQDFFALWKDADPDIPILKQAKAEYARLQ
jgi:tetratricopeptide (TPR) repeat protein